MKLSEERKARLTDEVKYSATRSSGPGGQNVNKVSSRVELRFSVDFSNELTAGEKLRIFLKLKNRINSNGELVLTSQTERSQLANKEKVTEHFLSLIEKTLTLPKHRKKTSPTKASRIKRLDSKKLIGIKKRLRKPPES